MKSVAYVIAGLAAVGIMVVLIVAPTAPTDRSEDAAQTAAAQNGTAQSASDLVAMTVSEPGTMTLEIPSMHCQFACYPRVKETLEKSAGVSEVALVDQPDPNALTVKKVTVKYDAGFDIAAALASLQKQGFEDAQQIQ